MSLQMRLATQADTDGIARVARRAFDPATDAMARNLFPEHLQPANPSIDDAALAWRRTHKGIKGNMEGVLLMVVTDGELNNKIVGFSLWEEPVPERSVGDETKLDEPIPCETLDEEAYRILRSVMAEASTNYLGKDGYSHMWFLDYLAVDPDHQRRGIGKMLLNWGLEKASADNKDTFLIATPAGVPLYETMGFKSFEPFMLFKTPYTGMIKHSVVY